MVGLKCPCSSRWESFLASSYFHEFLYSFGLWSHNSNLCLCLHMDSSLRVCLSFPVSFKELTLDLGPTLTQDDLTCILALIISAKTLFPNKVIFSCIFWSNTIQPIIILFLISTLIGKVECCLALLSN